MQLNPIIDAKYGAYFPSINDCSAESAEWFIANGQYESAKRVIRNLESWGHEMTEELEECNKEAARFEYEKQTYHNKAIELEMQLRNSQQKLKRAREERDMFAKSFNQSQDRVLKYSNDVTEMDERYAELYANFQDLLKDYKRMEYSRDDAVIVADSVSFINGRRFKENKGLRKSYGIVKRKMLALKRKVKEMTEVIYTQAQTIEDLRYRIEDLERENSELNEKVGNKDYADSLYYHGEDW